MSFQELGICPWLINALSLLSIDAPTPIQVKAIPAIISGEALKCLLIPGRDVIASAKTGSGKTAAFALPILQSLATDPYGVYALVLTPTR